MDFEQYKCIKAPAYRRQLSVSDEPLREQFEQWAKTYKLRYLLAHGDDGVLWGHIREGKLLTSEAAARRLGLADPAMLGPQVLHEARIFGKKAEVHLWAVEDGFAARLLSEHESGETFAYTQALLANQLLWGTRCEGYDEDGFSLVYERGLGLHHVPPIKHAKGPLKVQLQLQVKHYLNPFSDTDPEARIVESRLTGIKLDSYV